MPEETNKDLQSIESVSNVYAEKTEFWNFKDRKVYKNWKDKVGDFVFGLFGWVILNKILNILFSHLGQGIKEFFLM